MRDVTPELIGTWMGTLCAFPDRSVGGPGNRAATTMFSEHLEALGFAVRREPFDCIVWERGDAVLMAGGERIPALVGPYSLAGNLAAPLVAASRIEDLESERIRGNIVLIHGDLARSQVMPKNFTFYNPDSHRRIVRALETFAPAAVIAATGTNPEMVGSQYPFPLFEDGDLDVPNAYMKDVDGERLLAHAGGTVALSLDSRRLPSTAEHVVATIPGDRPGRILVTAHIDSREDAPGALDNASGVAVLLGVAELLGDYATGPSIEIVPFNGEDNYANPGEMIWWAENEDRSDDIVLGINIDDLGMKGTVNHVSRYGCPPAIEEAVRPAIAAHPDFAEGPQWYQGDHMLLSLRKRPVIALASSDMVGFMEKYAHTERDTIDLADFALIAEAARFVRDVIARVAALE